MKGYLYDSTCIGISSVVRIPCWTWFVKVSLWLSLWKTSSNFLHNYCFAFFSSLFRCVLPITFFMYILLGLGSTDVIIGKRCSLKKFKLFFSWVCKFTHFKTTIQTKWIDFIGVIMCLCFCKAVFCVCQGFTKIWAIYFSGIINFLKIHSQGLFWRRIPLIWRNFKFLSIKRPWNLN